MTKTVTGLQNSAPLYVRSSPNPAQVGKPITLIVEVMPVSDRQTGNVKFFADGQPLGTIPLKDGCDPGNLKCRTATLTTGTLATLATSTLPAGRHIITATYEGDNNYSLSTSSPLTQTITISPVKDLKPITLTVASGNKAMQLNWNPTSDPTVNSYNILRHAGVNDRIKTLAAKLPLKPEYPDSNALVPGLTYCYRVEARRNDGTVAVTSNEACKVFGALELSVPDTLGRPGEIVIVPVNIANANGLRIASSDIWLDFNGAIIQSVVVSRTALTKNYTWDFSVQDSATPPTTTKRLRIALINNKPEELRGTGPLFWLVFKVKGQPGQTSPLDLKDFITNIGGSSIQDIANPSQDVPLRLTDGLFTVGAAGAGFTLGDVDGDGLIRAKDALRALSLAVDKPKPSPRELLAGDINSNKHIDAADASMILFFAAHGSWPLPPKKSTVSASAVQADAVVRLSSAQAQPGQAVRITLQAANLAQEDGGIAGGDFQIAYDPNVVKRVVNITPTGLAANFNVDFHDDGNGLLAIALSKETEITGSGDLLTIDLELQSNAPVGASPLTLASASLHDVSGRDFVTSFANNTLTPQSGAITVAQGATGSAVYLPLVTKK